MLIPRVATKNASLSLTHTHMKNLFSFITLEDLGPIFP